MAPPCVGGVGANVGLFPRESPVMLRVPHLLAWLAPALLAASAIGLRADTVTFKDGFVLEGKIKRENKTIVDPASREPIQLADGLFMVDDGARLIVFSPSH